MARARNFLPLHLSPRGLTVLCIYRSQNYIEHKITIVTSIKKKKNQKRKSKSRPCHFDSELDSMLHLYFIMLRGFLLILAKA